MRLILGGRAQGKRAYVQNTYKIRAEEFRAGETEAFEELREQRAFDSFHLWVRRKYEEGAEVMELTKRLLAANPDCIILCDEVGCGIVPLERAEREYRELVGRIQILLAERAVSVERIICGISQKIK